MHCGSMPLEVAMIAKQLGMISKTQDDISIIAFINQILVFAEKYINDYILTVK